jgi:hypothetical protein
VDRVHLIERDAWALPARDPALHVACPGSSVGPKPFGRWELRCTRPRGAICPDWGELPRTIFRCLAHPCAHIVAPSLDGRTSRVPEGQMNALGKRAVRWGDFHEQVAHEEPR